MFILVGILAGYLAGKVMRGGGFGLIRNLCLGLVGAFVGPRLLDWVGFGPTSFGFVGETLVAALGASVVLWVVGLLRGD